VLQAANAFKDKTTAINQLWQSDVTYIKVLGWGGFYLSTVLHDYSRYVVSCKLCTNMRAEDVTDTLDLALQASACDQTNQMSQTLSWFWSPLVQKTLTTESSSKRQSACRRHAS